MRRKTTPNRPGEIGKVIELTGSINALIILKGPCLTP
jgi:hypothetical protein